MAITDNTAQWKVKKVTNFTDKSAEIATQAQATEATDNTKIMTPLRTKQLGDNYYVPKSGGTMSGVLNLKGGLYEDAYSGALNLNNSDIYGVNSIYTADLSDSSAEGIHFYRDTTHVDTFYAKSGVLYFVPNRELGTSGTSKEVSLKDDVAHLLQNNTNAQTIVGYKNSIYRGKYLGSSLTSAQSATIRAGEFDDLFIGDYWTIGGVNYRIAAFDYYYNCGDTACTTHHVVVVPDTYLYTAQMNAENVVTGGYVGSDMYTTNLNQAKTTISNAFGTDHLLTIRQVFTNAVTGSYATGGTWYDAVVWLMNEINVYGCPVFTNCTQGSNWAYNYTIDNTQYPLFALNPRMIHTRQTYWLRDVADSTHFASVHGSGNCSHSGSSYSCVVRPAFLVY